MKSFAKVAVAGVTGVALFKLFVTVLMPVLGLAFGLLVLALKVAVIGAVAYFLYSLLRPRDASNGDGGKDEHEIVVEEDEASKST